MTDKQIIIDVKCPISEKCKEFNNCKIQDILQQLKRKEQECEELKKDLSEESKLGHKAVQDEADTFFDLLKAEEQLDQLKAQLLDQEAETLKAGGAIHKLEKTLIEIKPILEFYANSKIGEKEGNGTYKILLNGGCILNYDPKPAIEALVKISEVLDD